MDKYIVKFVSMFIAIIIFPGVLICNYFLSGGNLDFFIQPLIIIILLIYIPFAAIISFGAKNIKQALCDAISKEVEFSRYRKDIIIIEGIWKLIFWFAITLFVMNCTFIPVYSQIDDFELFHSIGSSIVIFIYVYLIKLLVLLPMENMLKVKLVKEQNER